MVLKFQRWRIKNMAKARGKMKGGINFSFLENLSTNLDATFQKCTLYTCKVSYYTTVFMKGGVCFMPPYTTFTPPFSHDIGYSSALKYSQTSFFTPPFSQECYHPALQAVLQHAVSLKGGVCNACLVLKGVMKGGMQKYATFQSGQGVATWQR